MSQLGQKATSTGDGMECALPPNGHRPSLARRPLRASSGNGPCAVIGMKHEPHRRPAPRSGGEGSAQCREAARVPRYVMTPEFGPATCWTFVIGSAGAERTWRHGISRSPLGAVTKAPPLRTSLSTSQSGGLDIAWAVWHRTVAAEHAAVVGFGFQLFTAMMDSCDLLNRSKRP